MSNLYNTDWLTLIFDAKCVVIPENLEVLMLWNFTLFGGMYKGSILSKLYQDFVFSFNDLSILNRCLVYINYDIQMTVEALNDLTCNFEQTNKLFYNGMLQPEAWHLDALDKKIDHKYSWIYSKNNTVDLWILDTGINWLHREFLPGQVIDVDPLFTIKNLSHPHGTGTASAAGGLFYGSSKRIKIYNFPICRNYGSCASVWTDKAFQKILSHLKEKPGRRSVINMSVGSYYGEHGNVSALSQYYNAVFEELLAYGAIIVVSAGNANQDACDWIYSFSPFVISVGSLDKNYNKSSFSNWGNCVDIWSFGSNVPVAYSIKNNTVIQYKSGTSFSSPIVAGLIANILQTNSNLKRGEVLSVLYDRISQFHPYLIPNYVCGQGKPKCCQGYLRGSRLDAYCREKTFEDCPKSCKIEVC